MSVIIGSIINISSSLIGALGLVLERKATLLSESQTSAHKNKLWFIGFVMYLLGALLSIVSLVFLSQPVYAVLNTMSIGISSFWSFFILKEKLNIRELLSLILIMMGASIAAVFAPKTSNETPTFNLYERFFSDDMIIYWIIVIILLILCYSCTYFLARKARAHATILPFVYASIGGILGGQVSIFAKISLEIIKISLNDNTISYYDNFINYIIIILWLGFFYGRVHYLVQGLGRYESKDIIPTNYVQVALFTAISGLVYFEEISSLFDFSNIDNILTIVGFIICCSGIIAMNHKSSSEDDRSLHHFRAAGIAIMTLETLGYEHKKIHQHRTVTNGRFSLHKAIHQVPVNIGILTALNQLRHAWGKDINQIEEKQKKTLFEIELLNSKFNLIKENKFERFISIEKRLDERLLEYLPIMNTGDIILFEPKHSVVKGIKGTIRKSIKDLLNHITRSPFVHIGLVLVIDHDDEHIKSLKIGEGVEGENINSSVFILESCQNIENNIDILNQSSNENSVHVFPLRIRLQRLEYTSHYFPIINKLNFQQKDQVGKKFTELYKNNLNFQDHEKNFKKLIHHAVQDIEKDLHLMKHVSSKFVYDILNSTSLLSRKSKEENLIRPDKIADIGLYEWPSTILKDLERNE